MIGYQNLSKRALNMLAVGLSTSATEINYVQTSSQLMFVLPVATVTQ